MWLCLNASDVCGGPHDSSGDVRVFVCMVNHMVVQVMWILSVLDHIMTTTFSPGYK